MQHQENPPPAQMPDLAELARSARQALRQEPLSTAASATIDRPNIGSPQPDLLQDIAQNDPERLAEVIQIWENEDRERGRSGSEGTLGSDSPRSSVSINNDPTRLSPAEEEEIQSKVRKLPLELQANRERILKNVALSEKAKRIERERAEAARNPQSQQTQQRQQADAQGVETPTADQPLRPVSIEDLWSDEDALRRFLEEGQRESENVSPQQEIQRMMDEERRKLAQEEADANASFAEMARNDPEGLAHAIQVWLEEDERGENPNPIYWPVEGARRDIGARPGPTPIPPIGPTPRGPEPAPGSAPVPAEARREVRQAMQRRSFGSRAWDVAKDIAIGTAAGFAIASPLSAAGFAWGLALVAAGAGLGGFRAGWSEARRLIDQEVQQRAAGVPELQGRMNRFRKHVRNDLRVAGAVTRGAVIAGSFGILGQQIALHLWGPRIVPALSEGVSDWISEHKETLKSLGLRRLDTPTPSGAEAPVVTSPVDPVSGGTPSTEPSGQVAAPERDWFGDYNTEVQKMVGARDTQAYIDPAIRRAIGENAFNNLDPTTLGMLRNEVENRLEVKANEFFYGPGSAFQNAAATSARFEDTTVQDALNHGKIEFNNWLGSQSVPTELTNQARLALDIHNQINNITEPFRNANIPNIFNIIRPGENVAQILNFANMDISFADHIGKYVMLNWEELAKAWPGTHPGIPLPVQQGEVSHLIEQARGGDWNAFNRLKGICDVIPKQELRILFGISEDALKEIKNLYGRF